MGCHLPMQGGGFDPCWVNMLHGVQSKIETIIFPGNSPKDQNVWAERNQVWESPRQWRRKVTKPLLHTRPSSRLQSDTPEFPRRAVTPWRS